MYKCQQESMSITPTTTAHEKHKEKKETIENYAKKKSKQG